MELPPIAAREIAAWIGTVSQGHSPGARHRPWAPTRAGDGLPASSPNELFLRRVLMQQLVHVPVSAELGEFQRGHAVSICSVDTCTRLDEYPRCTNLILLLLGTIRAVPMHGPEQRGRSELQAPCLNVGVMCDQEFDG